jgi:hypothetical protein
MPRSVNGIPQSNLTIEELASAHPPCGNGAPSRTRSHYDRIVVLLRERGPVGVLSSELYDNSQLYGRSPRNRISEARQAGYLIATVPVGGSVVRYILIRDNDGAPPPQLGPAPNKPNRRVPVSDYMRRIHEEKSAAAPLFAHSEQS